MRNCQAQKEFDWSGPTATPVSRAFKMPAPMVFVLKANEIRRTNKIYGPPFNPFEYADALGVTVQEVADLPIDGLLKRTASGSFVVQLKKDVCQSRKNFTLAHELAHTFFYDQLMAGSPKFRGSNKADPVEEALCNVGARELLMPGPFFRRDLKSSRQDGMITPITLIELSGRYQVSLQAAAIRTVTIEKGVACAMWEKAGRAVQMRWVAPNNLGRLVLCQTSKSSIELAFRGPPSVVTTANDSFYCMCEVRRRIIRKTLSRKSLNGSVLSVMYPRGRSQKPVQQNGQTEVPEQWWQRY